MGTFFELGKDKAAKGEGWALPFISCAQVCPRYSGTLTPLPLRLLADCAKAQNCTPANYLRDVSFITRRVCGGGGVCVCVGGGRVHLAGERGEGSEIYWRGSELSFHDNKCLRNLHSPSCIT